MDYRGAIEPVTVFKSKSAELIKKARESGQPIIITQKGRATAVLQDVESFQRQREALLLLQFLAAGDRQIKAGKSVSQARAERHFSRTLARLRGE